MTLLAFHPILAIHPMLAFPWLVAGYLPFPSSETCRKEVLMQLRLLAPLFKVPLMFKQMFLLCFCRMIRNQEYISKMTRKERKTLNTVKPRKHIIVCKHLKYSNIAMLILIVKGSLKNFILSPQNSMI